MLWVFFVLRFVGVFFCLVFVICVGFLWFCVVLCWFFFCSWVFFLFYLDYYYFTKNKIILFFGGGVKFYFPLCFCDLGKGCLFGFQETAGFMYCWC